MASTYQPLLSYGSRGDAVRRLQTLLNQRGYNLAVDGGYGPLTRAAVTDYQKKYGLRVDGALAAGTVITLATLPTGYRPGRVAPLAVSLSSGAGVCHVTTTGNIRFFRSTAIAAGSSVAVRFAGWFIA